MLGGAGFEGGELSRPCGQGSTLKRAWSQGWVVANAQVGDFLVLLLKVLLG